VLSNRLILLDLPKFISSFQVLTISIMAPILYMSVILLRPSWNNENEFKLLNILLPGFILLFYIAPLESKVNYMKYEFITDNMVKNNLELSYLNDYDNTPKRAQEFIASYNRIDSQGERPNIILLILESGSSVDSRRTSGISNYLPGLDAIQSKGITYTNFVANSNTTDNALIAMLKGINTIPFSTNTDNYEAYKTNEIPLPEYLNQNGYKTQFITTGPLSFLDKKSFLENVGYNKIIGSEDFSDQKRYTFNSAADEHLYNTALEEVVSLNNGDTPYFLTLLTISQHLVYYTPYGLGKENMYRYTDATLVQFYDALKNTGFFESGILMIVGDHRKMTPLESGEYEEYGMSSYGRIICTVTGKGIPNNHIDNNIYQQTDVYYSFKRMISDTFIDAPPYNDIFLSDIQRPYATHSLFSNRSSLVAITKDTACKVRLDGDNSAYEDCPGDTEQHQRILNSIANMRAHQFSLNTH